MATTVSGARRRAASERQAAACTPSMAQASVPGCAGHHVARPASSRCRAARRRPRSPRPRRPGAAGATPRRHAAHGMSSRARAARASEPSAGRKPTKVACRPRTTRLSSPQDPTGWPCRPAPAAGLQWGHADEPDTPRPHPSRPLRDRHRPFGRHVPRPGTCSGSRRFAAASRSAAGTVDVAEPRTDSRCPCGDRRGELPHRQRPAGRRRAVGAFSRCRPAPRHDVRLPSAWTAWP